jgi:hypothetical protein
VIRDWATSAVRPCCPGHWGWRRGIAGTRSFQRADVGGGVERGGATGLGLVDVGAGGASARNLGLRAGEGRAQGRDPEGVAGGRIHLGAAREDGR